MYKYCVTEESARRQRQLESCLLELMLQGEYPQITISHICDRAGISRKSFYRYFSSKEGCLYALMDHAIFDGASYYLPGLTDRQSTRIIYERFFTYWKNQHKLLDALSQNNLSMMLVERMLVYVSSEEQEFRLMYQSRKDDTHEQSLFYIGGIMSVLLEWHKSGYRKSITQMSQILSDLI